MTRPQNCLINHVLYLKHIGCTRKAIIVKKNTKLTIHVQHKGGDFNLMTPLIYACL